VGIIGSTSDAGFFIADERGYFAEQGLDFQIVPFQSGPDMVPPAGTGQIEVATGAPSAGLYNAIGRGIPLKIVAGKGAQQPGFIFSSIVLRKDLLDNGTIKTWADLKGQKMAVAGLGNSGHVFLDKALRRGGLTWHDVDLAMLSYADIGAALANKAIYGGVTIEPFRTQWPAKGIGAYLPDDNDIYVNQQAAVVMYGPQFIQTQPDAARRLMVAYLRGVRAYNDAFVKKIERDAIVDILVRRTTLTDRSLYDQIGFPALNPNGGVLADDLAAQQEWYVENGYQTARIDIASAIDTQFSEYAVKQLGTYTT
jgi:NitT/TauT family transport system substrate-binding protein